MASHWTYEDIPAADSDLKQGDILYPTEKLRRIFDEVHPHFTDPKYLGFLVVTHCCDLVRRGDRPCKADHISLAVIRDFETLLETFLNRVCQRISAGIYSRKSKAEAHDLVTRILNQNEQALGLFYLHPNMEADGIAEEAVALLRVTVSLRAKEHYETMQDARRGRLQSDFRNKLGWLVGNLYSRIGTPDWADQENGERQLKTIIDKLLKSEQYVWVEESWVRSARNNGVSLEQLSREEVLAALDEHKPEPLKTQITAAASALLNELISELPHAIAGGASQAITDELKQQGVASSKMEVLTALDKSLATSWQAVADSIAATAINSVLPESDSATQHLAQRCQASLRASIEDQIRRLPEKLSYRLLNSPVVSRAIEQDDAS